MYSLSPRVQQRRNHRGAWAVRARASPGENLLFDDAIEDADLFWLSLSQKDSDVSLLVDDEEYPTWGRSTSQTVFTQARWAAHRSTDRYLRHLFGIFSSATFESLVQPLTLLTGNAVILTIYQTIAENSDQLPSFLHGLPVLYLGDGPFDLAAYALSLLLVFRTDSSYDRWNEALSVWSDVKNVSKEFVRDSACWVKDPTLLKMIVRWTITFSKSLEIYVQGGRGMDMVLPSGRPFPKVLADVLLEHECETLERNDLSPHYSLHVLTEVIERAKLGEIREEKLLYAVSALNDAVGTSEKILRYPIPLSYTRHTSRFMLLWLAFLPIAMWDDMSWAVIPATGIMSFLMLGIDQIGVQIEEPFSTLPISDITTDIMDDILTINKSKNDVAELVNMSMQAPALSSGEFTAPLEEIIYQQRSSSLNNVEAAAARYGKLLPSPGIPRNGQSTPPPQPQPFFEKTYVLEDD